MNPLAYMIASTLVGGGLVYLIQSRIRVRELRDTTAIQTAASAAKSPMEMMAQQIQIKDAQIAQVQQQHADFVDSQMKRNDAGTEAILNLAEQVRVQTSNLAAVVKEIQEHRAESATRAGKIYENIGKVNERLAGLEATVKSTLDTATDASKISKAAAETVERVARESRS